MEPHRYNRLNTKFQNLNKSTIHKSIQKLHFHNATMCKCNVTSFLFVISFFPPTSCLLTFSFERTHIHSHTQRTETPSYPPPLPQQDLQQMKCTHKYEHAWRNMVNVFISTSTTQYQLSRHEISRKPSQIHHMQPFSR